MRSRAWAGAAALVVCVCHLQVAIAAGPAPAVEAPGDLSSVLIDPPSPDYAARPNGMVGSTHIGPLDLATVVAENNGSPSVRSELTRQGYTRGYRKLWVQEATTAVLIERVEEYRFNIGAEDHLVRARLVDERGKNFRSFLDVSVLGITYAYGERQVSSNNLETDDVIFVKGNLLFVIAAGRPDQSSADVALNQARAQLAAAPDETIDQSGAPDSLSAPPLVPAGTRPNAVAIGVVAAALLVLALPALLLVVLAARRRPRRPAPLLSADRRYWWDGSAWRDTAASIPHGAPRSPDGAYWFDGVAWRPVDPTRFQ